MGTDWAIDTVTFRRHNLQLTWYNLGAMEEELSGLQQWLIDERVIPAGVTDERVVGAMRSVPRHMFVPAGYRESAYVDGALPIGNGQTISQPSLVGLMTQMLEIKPTDKVLEIGTGSGYQAAILAELAKEVYTIERIGRLAKQARQTLIKLGYDNVRVIEADGSKGYPKAAPYNAMLVTAAADKIPTPLEEQLADGGRILVPLKKGIFGQVLMLGERQDGEIEYHERQWVRFVPLIIDDA